MNIMKTNMLLLDNKIMKEDAGNTTTAPAPVPSEDTSKAGMKALSFLGMQNLMANPKLAQGIGVMNNISAEKSSADSYVAPYSSNIAFQGTFGKFAQKVGNKATQVVPASIIALSTLLPSALALSSCGKDLTASQSQTVIVDMNSMIAAIDALREEIKANNEAQSARDKEILAVLQQALAVLMQMQNMMQSQALTNEAFRELLLGKMDNAENQRTAILQAIMTLQNISESQAKDILNNILLAFENGKIDFQTAMAQIIALLTENNELLSSILNKLDEAIAKADEHSKALLNVANEINQNGKATVAQQNIMIAQNSALIAQNNILIKEGQELIKKANQLNMSVKELTTVAKFIGKSLEDVIKMSKAEILAEMQKQTALLEGQNATLEEINNGLTNHTLSFDEAAKIIIELLGNIDKNVSDIKAMLEEHFAKYDLDMAQLKAIAFGIKVEQQKTRQDVQRLAFAAFSMANDIKKMSIDLKDIRTKLKNGVAIDYNQLEEMFKRINANQQMSANEIIARLDAFLEKQDGIAAKLDETNEKLSKLGFVVSNDVINAINNIGDNLEGLADINTKLDELIAAVKSLVTSFDLYAKYAAKAHNEEMAALDSIKANFKDLKNKIDVLIQQGKVAETQRNLTNNYLEALLKKADQMADKLGRIPTVEEFDAMLTVHDEANQQFYADLIKKSGVNPADFSNIEDLLKAIKEALIDFQGTTNKYLADILARIKAMDPTAKDYTEKLNKIIELLENFKCECNCQCDCDHNQSIHEGIIDIIG